MQNLNLLYIEDDKETQQLIKSLLEDYVGEIYLASNGKEGLDIYKKHSPNVIITDIYMPIMNGIDMIKEIRKTDDKTPIAIISASNEITYLKSALNLKVNNYISKPITDDSIFEMLKGIHKSFKKEKKEKDLQKMIKIQNKAATIGEMIGNIAHQWKQPLSIISLHASSLKSFIDMELDIEKDQLIELSEDILTQTKYLSETIDDFRNFLKSDIKKITTINLKNTIRKIDKLIYSSLKDNSITCTSSIEELSIVGNENQLIQALIIIINNSKDAIIMNNCPDRYIFISLKKTEKNIVISIKDSGRGIDEENIDKVFNLYFTTKNKNEGTGIGLHIAEQIIEKSFKGKIEVKNTKYEHEGKKLEGASFDISLPI